MNIDEISNKSLQIESEGSLILTESPEAPYILFSDSSDKEALCLACQRDQEIERGEVKALPHTELMNRLRLGN